MISQRKKVFCTILGCFFLFGYGLVPHEATSQASFTVRNVINEIDVPAEPIPPVTEEGEGSQGNHNNPNSKHPATNEKRSNLMGYGLVTIFLLLFLRRKRNEENV